MQVKDDGGLHPLDRELGVRVLEVLHRHYPGWGWTVDVPSGQNVVVVRNLDCDPRGTYGILLKKDRLSGGDMSTKVMLAGGEFLERYRMIRQAYKAAEELGISERKMIFERPDS